jgi:hypothetical protein
VKPVAVRERLLRWFPETWRARYGEEFLALLEDAYGEGRVPLAARVSIARAGTVERTRAAGVTGTFAAPAQRLRSGSQVVLVGWSLFIVAGAVFSKFTDRWRGATPSSHRALPTIAFDAVGGAGALGVVLVLSAAAVVFPSFVRFLRAGGWSAVRRPLLGSLAAAGIALAASTSTVLWAQTLNVQERNGTLVAYEVVVVASGLCVVAALATLTWAAVSVSRRLDHSRVVLHFLVVDASALVAMMVVVTTGTVLWWTCEALYAPSVIRDGLGNGIVFSSDVAPVTLLAVMALMVTGLVAGLFGWSRVVRCRRAALAGE